MMDILTRKKRIRFRSWHRGCKETDILLGNFCDMRLDSMSEAELDAFEAVLDVEDADLYRWLTGELPLPEAMQSNPIMVELMQFEPTNIWAAS